MAPRLSCSVACRILVPRPRIEPASPALQGGFLTTGLLPGKAPSHSLKKNFFFFGCGPFSMQNNTASVVYILSLSLSLSLSLFVAMSHVGS